MLDFACLIYEEMKGDEIYDESINQMFCLVTLMWLKMKNWVNKI